METISLFGSFLQDISLASIVAIDSIQEQLADKKRVRKDVPAPIKVRSSKIKRSSRMPQAVRFNQYGDVDVLQVVDVERPKPGAGQVLVQVKAAGINPGEASIRKGLLHSRWPATFPSGEGSDLAGVIAELGEGVHNFAVGDEVIGFTDNRASHAEFVL